VSALQRIRSLGVLSCSLALAACGASIGSQQSYTEGTDPATGNPEASYSTNAQIYGDADEKRLEGARAMTRQRNYPEAIAVFEDMAEDSKVKDEFREGALFSLGEAQGAIFNPNKNYEVAILTLERFLNLYPDSERADKARALITSYQQILEQL